MVSPSGETDKATSPTSATLSAASPRSAASPPADNLVTSDPLGGDHWAHQPVPVLDDGDSAIDSSILSSTASLSASILEYRTVHGRTYHSDKLTENEYWGPNDEKQNEAQDIIHHSLTLILDGKLFRAPIDTDKVQRVLDVGTGTGLWAIDFADQYENVAEVIGTDISPIQPSWVPPNVKFEIEDATKPWTFKENYFDFVHLRYLFGCISDWNALFAEAYRVTKPGGWVETFEADTAFFSEDETLVPGSPMHTWGLVFKEAGRKIGRTFYPIEDDVQRKGLEAAGFTNLDVWTSHVPVTDWPRNQKLKEIGTFSKLSLESDLEGMILYTFRQMMDWSDIEIAAYTAHFRRQLRDNGVHPMCKIRVVTAQKPFDAT